MDRNHEATSASHSLRSAKVMPSFSSEGITVPSRRKQRGTSFATFCDIAMLCMSLRIVWIRYVAYVVSPP